MVGALSCRARIELGSVRSDGELAGQLGPASGMRVLFPEYRLGPSEHPFAAAVDDALAAGCRLRVGQDLSARSMAVAGGPPAEGSLPRCSRPSVTPGRHRPRPPR